jgi:hypothetical protein
MIAVSTSGKNFQALASYLVNGRSGEEQDRVAWTAARNLPTADVELAATFMKATASRSDPVEKPVYHVVLSFDPKDTVDRQTIEGIADRLLARLGLAEHQAVIVAHRDRQHAHVHLFVNRVHPETRKAWERWKDQPIIQAVLREEERTLGLRQVPGRLAPTNERHAEAGERTLRAQVPGKPSRLTEEVVSDLRTYERVLALAKERYAALLATDTDRHQATQNDAAAGRARSAAERFQLALAQVYRDPAAARQTFEAAVVQKGPAVALRSLQDSPEQFSELKSVQRRHLFGLARVDDPAGARAAAREAAQLGSQFVVAQRAAREMEGAVAGKGKSHNSPPAKVAALDREARRLPSTSELEYRLGRALRAITPRELDRLRLLVTAPQLALMKKIQAAVQDVVLGRDEAVRQ